MYFCPDCNNLYDISKTIPSAQQPIQQQQTGGKKKILSNPVTSDSATVSETISDTNTITETNTIADIIKKDNDSVSLSEEDLDKLVKSKDFNDLPEEKKSATLIKIKNKQDDQSNIYNDKQAGAYFICKKCGRYDAIREGTLIVSKQTGESLKENIEPIDYKNMTQLSYLPITRKYICPNEKCESHKNYALREAVFFRIPTRRVRYVCKACLTSFTS